jgi:hypothetical protein
MEIAVIESTIFPLSGVIPQSDESCAVFEMSAAGQVCAWQTCKGKLRPRSIWSGLDSEKIVAPLVRMWGGR